MRWAISGVAMITGTILLFLLSAGAFLDAESMLSTANPDPWERALSPLWSSGFTGAVVLVVGAILTLTGAGLLFWSLPEQKERRQPWQAARVLQAAFALNILLAAMLVLITSLALRHSAQLDTIGHLFMWTVSVIVAGSFLAFALVWQIKSRWLFTSLVTIHLVEAGAVAAVFVNGYAG